MTRVFLSHSSSDKKFVCTVAETFGDIAIIDERDFRAGARTMDEIVEKISDSKIFVAFLSQKSLDSDWVQKELALAIEHSERNDINILIFSLDRSVSYNDSRIPDKLRRHYNIKYVNKPEYAISRIRDEIRKLKFIQNPAYKEAETLFIGRSDLTRNFETDFANLNDDVPTFIVASNYYSGMGRRHFVRHALDKINILKHTENPISISLQKGDSIETFIIKLNSSIFDDEVSKANLKDLPLDKKQELLLRLVIDYKKYNRIIFIIDEGAIVLPNHEIVDWFVNLSQNPKLHNRLTFCIISSWSPSYKYLNNDNVGVSYHVDELDGIDTQNLFIRLLSIYGIKNLSFASKKEFISHLTGIPSQIKFAVQQIRSVGENIALTHIEDIKEHSDSYSFSLVEAIKKNNLAYQICLILANGSVSLDVIHDVFGESENVNSAITFLLDYSALEFLSGTITSVRLNPTLSDFIKRRSLKPDSDVVNRFQYAISTYTSKSLDELVIDDYSKFLLVIEDLIKNGKPIPDKYYIAPILIHNIIKDYHAGKYDSVESFCIKLLRQTNVDPQVLWELHYHLVRVYARTGRDKFWDALNNSSLKYIDREFLIGFFYRNKKNQSEIKNALQHFENVLNEDPNHRRARREIVNTYLLLDDYPNALKYAEENYKKSPSDILHLQSYFIALIRNKDFDSYTDGKVLVTLMENAKSNPDTRANDVLKCMKGEYAYWVKHEFSEAVEILTEAERTNQNRRYPLKALLLIYLREGMPDKIHEIKRKLSDL